MKPYQEVLLIIALWLIFFTCILIVAEYINRRGKSQCRVVQEAVYGAGSILESQKKKLQKNK
jgi:hypothetical protein